MSKHLNPRNDEAFFVLCKQAMLHGMIDAACGKPLMERHALMRRLGVTNYCHKDAAKVRQCYGAMHDIILFNQEVNDGVRASYEIRGRRS